MHDFLRSFGDDLRFVFITSQARLVEHEPGDAAPTSLDGVSIKVHASPHTKCERCWHYRADVAVNAEHPEICGRCVANLYGPGEPRAHA
jgi:isoleucyl-tRNA synthetase